MSNKEVGQHVGECSRCIHRRSIPGDCHIRCAKPDPNMTGDRNGVVNGWFMYPINFDPTWKTKACANFEPEGPDAA